MTPVLLTQIKEQNQTESTKNQVNSILNSCISVILYSLNFHKFPKKSPEMGQSSMRASQGPTSSSQVVNHVSQVRAVSPALRILAKL